MPDNSVDFYSLCKVIEHPSNEIDLSLQRCADVSNGFLIPTGSQMISYDPRHNNVNYIYWKDGPSELGAYGIWHWVPKPNQKNPEKLFIESNYIGSPIEIIKLSQFKSLQDIVNELKTNGIRCRLVTDRVIFCPYFVKSGSQYDGVLCAKDDLDVIDNKVKIRDSVTSLPRCFFRETDIFPIDRIGSRLFYKRLDIELNQFIPVKNPQESVKAIILERITWRAAKDLDIKKSDWQKLTEFITESDTDSVFEEISIKCRCTLEEAKQYVKQFLLHVEKYIDHTSVDEDVLVSIIKNHPQLTSKIEALVTKQWEEKNSARIQEALETQSQIEEDLSNKKSSLTEIEEKTRALEEKYEEITLQLIENEELEKRIEEKIRQKLLDARNDVANILADYPFISFANTKPEELTEKNLPTNTSTAYRPGSKLPDDQLEPYETWENLIEILVDELSEASVLEKYKEALAVYLYSAYLCNMPVLLAGPNGESIANAFSSSLFGRNAGILDCSSDYDFEAIERMAKSNDQVIIVKNIFNNGWILHISDIISQQKKFFFILHPFTEDLLIEPKSLYNYAIPIFTETLVDGIPTGVFLGGKSSEEFEHPTITDKKPYYEKLLVKMGASQLFRSQIQKIISLYCSLKNEPNDDMKCLLALLPYAYLTENGEKMLEEMGAKLSNEMKKKCSGFLGIEEDE